MKMMPPDVISHENQLQHLSEPLIFILDVFRTADHAGQIFIPHRHFRIYVYTTAFNTMLRASVCSTFKTHDPTPVFKLEPTTPSFQTRLTHLAIANDWGFVRVDLTII